MSAGQKPQPVLEGLSEALAKVIEQRDQLKAELSHTKDRLFLAEAQASVLSAQVELHEQAAKVRQSNLTDDSPAKNPTSMWGTKKNTDEESGPIPTPSTPSAK